MSNMITIAEDVPCEIDVCMSSSSFLLELGGTKRWLCKDCMQELLDGLQNELNSLTTKKVELYDTKCGSCCGVMCGVFNKEQKSCHCEHDSALCKNCKHHGFCF